jgi:hypothetical protein
VKANTVLVAADVLIEACVQILQKVGVPRGQAEMIAKVVVEGDLRGVESHGVLRLPAYVHRVQAGLMTATTALEVLQERGATVLLDAQGGFGQVAGIHAMNHAIERARKHGVGLGSRWLPHRRPRSCPERDSAPYRRAEGLFPGARGRRLGWSVDRLGLQCAFVLGA